jgi:glycosyltransferase involved in cell wall biosynthesis
MKFSICIPQYNRIKFLLKSLSLIEKQTHPDIEVVISDDASVDETESEINKLRQSYRFPIVFHRFEKNQGYDRNYRKSIELATGDYCIVLGNDDSLYTESAIEQIVNFLEQNGHPEIGFCNFVEENNPGEIVRRASATKVLGIGPEIALRYYSCFSFVGGLIYKRSAFERFNTDRYDRSVFSQIALGCSMICQGNRLFSISEPIVLKDIHIDGKFRHSYRDRIAKKWKNFRIIDGGLKSVIGVLYTVFKNTGVLTPALLSQIFGKIFMSTLPFWILDYKYNRALPEAVGIFVGMRPWKVDQFRYLSIGGRIKILFTYLFCSVAAFLVPAKLFYRHKNQLYAMLKK